MIERVALIALGAGCVLFGGIVVAEMTAPAGPATEAAIAVPPRAQTPLPAARPEIGAQYGAMIATILARPLFSTTRRPPPLNDGPAEDTSFSDTRLAGIVTEPGRRFAIFAPAGAKPMTVKEGDTVSGWRVDSITPLEVSLSGPGGTKTLQPKIDPNLAPPAPPTTTEAAPRTARPVNPVLARPPLRPGLPPVPYNGPPLRPGQLRGRR
ncbi:MAG: hypothetical protein WA184_16535 [Stellaceae bacterium]|jgi:hypothetical protein